MSNVYEDRHPYRAKIIDQVFTESKAGDPQLVLTCKLTARCLSKQNPLNGDEVCKPEEVITMITFKDDETSLDRAFAALAAADVLETDLEKVAEIDFKGKEVFVSPSVTEGSKTIYWNLLKPRSFKKNPVDAAKLKALAQARKKGLEEAAAKYKEKAAKYADTVAF